MGLLEAWIDSEGRGKDAKAIGARLAGAGSGLVHLGLGIVAVLARSNSKAAAAALRKKGGDGAEPARGGVLLWTAPRSSPQSASSNVRKAWSLKFLKHLKPEAAKRHWIPWLGRIGFAARGIVFLVIAWLFAQAARSHSSAAAGGIDDALGSLPRSVQIAVAAGVILFGLFSLTEAIYRKMPATRR